MDTTDRIELHEKLDALLDAECLPVAAMINSLHYEIFLRPDLPENHIEERIGAKLAAEERDVFAGKMTTEQVEELVFGEDGQIEFAEAAVRRVLKDRPEADQVLGMVLRHAVRRDKAGGASLLGE